MMDGEHFYALAVQLSSGMSAAELRSATSRAYYGAFHKAHELLQSIGITLPTGPECHQKVCFILGNSDDPDVRTVSTTLASLRNARNDADYDLAKTEPESKRSVVINLHRADQIICCIRSCFSGGAKPASRLACANTRVTYLGYLCLSGEVLLILALGWFKLKVPPLLGIGTSRWPSHLFVRFFLCLCSPPVC
jgi:uncharacterized protein (UPF0332 family)